MSTELTWTQWFWMGVSVTAFAYGEGYRALHRRFSPHVIARACELASERQSLRNWLQAPLYLLCLVRARRAAMLRGWLSVALILLAVVAVRQLPEPYRGIVDAGVAVALAIGLWSLARGFVAAVRGSAIPPR
jgi:hypothetical protein